MSGLCALGHTRKAMECPACSDSRDRDWWQWYRSRTSSKEVREKVKAVLADPHYFGDTTSGKAGDGDG